MTREENLYWIDQEIKTWENDCQSKHPIKEALYAARKALEQEHCEDCVNRQAVDGLVWKYLRKATDETIAFYEHFLDLPSVTLQPSRKGHWEVVSDGYSDNAYICECSECKDTVWVYKDADRKWNFCPNCGADMREVKEYEN